MPRGDEVARLPEWLEIIQDAGVDAVIVADLGAFRMAEKYAPKLSAISPRRPAFPTR